jgi:hypothetical protein
MQFANASSDVLQLKAIDRQLNTHVAEFTAAQTTETLAAVRTLINTFTTEITITILVSNEHLLKRPATTSHFSMGVSAVRYTI